MSQRSQNSRTLVFDIETNGLLLDVSKFWVGVTYCIETKKEEVYYDAKTMVQALAEADCLVGHNIIGYDIPALHKLTGIQLDVDVVDTYLLSKLAYYDKDRSFSHSLDAHGKRLGHYKGSHSDWSKLSDEMVEYCKQDVKVTFELYKHLRRKTQKWLPKEALELEQEVQKIMVQQYLDGWTFDTKAAQKLHIELTQEKEEAEKKLHEVFTPLFYPKGKVKTPKKPFTRLGVTTIGPHQPIELTTFNAGSGNHIVWWVEKLYGKQKWKLTEKGNPQTDADSLNEMFSEQPWAEPLLHYFNVNKLLGQLAEGDKAWLKQVHTDGKLHGSVDILGAVSGRSTHSNPNLAQVPSPRAYKGKESRQLFTHSKGTVNVGCDLSGVELRCLAHYMKDDEYTKQILEGDIHTYNQQAAGLPTRDMAKTMIYGYLYGAGDAKIGSIVKGGTKEGKKIRTTFETKIPAMGMLTTKVKEAAKRGYLIGITGRRLYVRSPHSALNTLLQSLGAYISKVWLVEIHKLIKERGINCRQLGHIHDEVQMECVPEQAELLGKTLEEAAVLAGERLGLRIRIDAEAQIGENWYDVH